MAAFERGDSASGEMTIRDLGHRMLGTDAEHAASNTGAIANTGDFRADKEDVDIQRDGPCVGPAAVLSHPGDIGTGGQGMTVGELLGWAIPALRSEGDDGASSASLGPL